MTKIIAVAALLLLPAISRAQAVTGRTQIAFTADRIPATTASEALFSLTLSTFNTNGATLGGAAVNMYTITRGKSLNITNVFFGVESGGSAPAASRVAFKIRVSTSAKAGDCTVANPMLFEAIQSSTSTIKAVSPISINPGIAIQGNGNTTLCFTQFTPDWVNATNVSSTTISMSGYEL